LGIIDYLQEFNLEKKGENFLKMIINEKNAQISAVDPKKYAPRFFKFMRDSVLIDQRDQTGSSVKMIGTFKKGPGHRSGRYD
jgi:hypothetical protein